MPIVWSDMCGVDDCPALAAGASGFCIVHEGAKRAHRVPSGTRCVKCGREIEPGVWITRGSTLEAMEHAHCPAARPTAPRRAARPKPLLEGVEGL